MFEFVDKLSDTVHVINNITENISERLDDSFLKLHILSDNISERLYAVLTLLIILAKVISVIVGLIIGYLVVVSKYKFFLSCFKYFSKIFCCIFYFFYKICILANEFSRENSLNSSTITEQPVDESESTNILIHEAKSKPEFSIERLMVLDTWYFKHRENPIATSTTKTILSEKTGLTVQQVSSWLVHARKLDRKGTYENFHTNILNRSILEENFKITKFPGRSRRIVNLVEELSTQTNMSTAQIKKWFARHRFYEKKKFVNNES